MTPLLKQFDLVDTYKVLVAGHGYMACSVLEGLLQLPQVEIIGVFRWANRKQAIPYGLIEGEAELKYLTKANQLWDITCSGINSYAFMEIVKEKKPHCILLASWGEIVKPHMLSLPGVEFINLHPSLLPAHRGGNPYTSVIRAGETQSGVSFHIVDEGIDTGPVLHQVAVPVLENDTGDTLRIRCAVAAKEGIISLIPRLIKAQQVGDTPKMLAVAQERLENTQAASYFPVLSEADARIDWSDSPEAIERQSRALTPWMPLVAMPVFSKFQIKHTLLISRLALKKNTTLAGIESDPGVLLAIDSGKLIISSQKPDTVFVIEAFQFCLDGHLLPKWLSRLVLPWVLQIGTRFS
ncbi:MAG: hypothetical protein K2X01_01545 [Cyanobacteria bacterium]|nr:hypothetical protein [Cyanobacteriota bacterium]